MNIVAIIPARYASTRFPGKPLADICGKPMVQHVFERTQKAQLVDHVVVATDDQRIFDTVESFGGTAIMTGGHHQTGTDRLAEAAEKLGADLIVNVQGDEPLIDPKMIDQAVQPMRDDESLPMGTLKTRIDEPSDLVNPNVVKVVTDLSGCALYFSRSHIPYPRDLDGSPGVNHLQHAYRHIGLYVYRRDFLLKYPALPATPLEKLESLEQLRALEHGYRIRVVETALSSHGVDTSEDLDRVKKTLASSTGCERF